MNCGKFSRSGEFNGDDRNRECGDRDGRNGDSFQDHLTKEQLQCLEATFLKNWEEFYDLLNEACNADMPCFKNNEGVAFPNGCAGFKINTEATKQQYRTCKATSKPTFYEQKQNNTTEQESSKEYHNGFSEKQNDCEFTNYNDKQTNEIHNSQFIGKHCADELKKCSETLPKCTKNTKRKLSKNSRTPKNKTNESKDNIDSINDAESNKHVSDVNNSAESLPLRNLKSYAYEYYLKYMVIMSYLNTSSKWCWVKTKEILLLLLCILLIVAVAVWKLLWFLICVILKLFFFLILWVAYKVINCIFAIHLRYDIFGKIRCYISNGSDLLFLFTGLNLKSIFTRRKKDKVHGQENNVLIALPTSPEEAVEHLVQQTEDKPFKALCVTRESTNDEIKANYRKMALLVHPDKCFYTQADEAFKVLDSVYKTLTDPEKRHKLMEEEKRRKEWDEFTRKYSGFTEDFETMFNDMINCISCSKCHGKHKRNLVKDRTFYDARYCGDCNNRHSANDGDIWAENNLFGLNWTCYVCMDGEIYELTEWAECQNLRKTIPINCHRVVCRLGNQRPGTNGNRRHNKHSESSETKKRKKRRQRGRKS